MRDELSLLYILKLSVLCVIVSHGSSFITVNTEATKANVAGYPVTVASSLTLARHGQTDAEVQQSYANDAASAVVNLVEAPVEVIGPRVAESGIPRKELEKKRESGIAIEIETGSRDSGNTCMLADEVELKKCLYHGETGDDLTRILQATANRGLRSKVSEGSEDEEYDSSESGGSNTMEYEDEDEDDNENDQVVVDDEKVRRNIRRKAGRHYRQGPKIWDQWGRWTSCSVSCGAGKLTRWRHCVAGGCSVGEKEAQLKTCTFSAC